MNSIKPVGRVRKYHSNFYYVEVEGTVYECMLRGLIKKEGTEVLVGDFVELDSIDETQRQARVHGVTNRQNVISRPKMANADQAVVVYSLHEPAFDPTQLDRYLTHIELAGLEPVIVISKIDLAQTSTELSEIQDLYARQLGYQVFFTSKLQPDSFAPLQAVFKGKISVLAGPSGAGKSSLLNVLNPGLQLRVGEVSGKIERGQHTTRHVELIAINPADPHTLIADTPGFSNLRFNTVLPVQVERIFRDFEPYRGQCAFSDCLHLEGESNGDHQATEGCAVLAQREKLSESRYQSYQAMIAEAREYKEAAQSSSQKQEYGYKQVSKKGKDAVKILRLKEKNRDASRRTQRQQVVDQLESSADDFLEDERGNPV